MGHVGRRVRNGKVIYRVRYRGPDGRERSRNFKRKVDAENYLTTVESAKLAGTWTDPTHGKMTLAAWLEAWWETAADLRPRPGHATAPTSTRWCCHASGQHP